MRKLLLVTVLMAGVATCGPLGLAHGQFGPYGGYGGRGFSPITRPAYSPYLNLLRPGGSFTQNYFGMVRPELDFRSSIGGLQQQVQTNQQMIGSLDQSLGVPITGHPTYFLNTSGYFSGGRQGGQIGSFGRTAGGFQTPQRGAAGRIGGQNPGGYQGGYRGGAGR